jgi:hypothetical protein
MPPPHLFPRLTPRSPIPGLLHPLPTTALPPPAPHSHDNRRGGGPAGGAAAAGHLQLADPEARLAAFERQFGEYGGVNASIEVSTTFTVLEADTLPQIFSGQKGPDATHGGCYL